MVLYDTANCKNSGDAFTTAIPILMSSQENESGEPSIRPVVSSAFPQLN